MLPAAVSSAMDAGDPFTEALLQSQVWLQQAHHAMLGTVEAQLKHMRHENMRLRAVLEEAGLGEKAKITWPAPECKELVEAKNSEPSSDLIVQAQDEATSTAAPAVEPSPEVEPLAPAAAVAEAAATSAAESKTTASSAEMPSTLDSGPKDGPGSTEPADPLEEKAAAASSPSPTLASSPVPAASTPVTVGRAIEAALAAVGWQHLQVDILPPEPATSPAAAVVKISGTELLIRLECGEVKEEETGRLPILLASGDGGATWEALESLLRRRRLHKVVRAAPIATRTVEFTLDEAKSPMPSKVQPKSLSLAELANLPLTASSARASGCQRPTKLGVERSSPTASQFIADSPMYHHKVPAVAAAAQRYQTSPAT